MMAVGAFLHSALVKAGEVVVVVGEVAETILVVFSYLPVYCFWIT